MYEDRHKVFHAWKKGLTYLKYDLSDLTEHLKMRRACSTCMLCFLKAKQIRRNVEILQWKKKLVAVNFELFRELLITCDEIR